MKVALLNLPAIRPTMPPYSVGVIGNILNKIEKIDCDIYDVNLLFWDKIFSSNFNTKAKALSTYYRLDSKIRIDEAREFLKKSTISFEDYNVAMERIQNQMILFSELFDTKISFGRVEFSEKKYGVDELIAISKDGERNIFYETIVEQVRILEEKNYEVVFISIMCKEQLLASMTLANVINQHKSDLQIVIGGAYVDRFKEKFNNNAIKELFPNVLEGRAEKSIFQFLKNKYGFKTILSSNNYEFETFYSTIDIKTYYNMVDTIPIMASRFCYYHNCLFCDNYYNYEGEKRIELSAETVVEQMEEYSEKYGTNTFCFIDDCLSPAFAENLSELLGAQKKFSWYANMRFSESLTQEKYVRKLKMANCKQVFLGLESYSREELARMRKGIQIEWIVPAIRLLKQYGISVYISIMLGFPGQENSDYEKTKQFLFENEIYLDMVDINVFTMTPAQDKKNRGGMCEINNTSFMNCKKNFRSEDESKIINNRYMELIAWAKEKNKLATYWNRNFYLK